MTGVAPDAPPTVVTSGPAETKAVAAVLAGRCRPGDILLLAGDLGAGKTTFAQGFGAALGVAGAVTSPTFTLVRQYPCGPAGGSVRTLLHADLYRLDHLAEVVDLGLGELVEDAAVALVEWGDVAEPVLGAGALTVRIVADEEPADLPASTRLPPTRPTTVHGSSGDDGRTPPSAADGSRLTVRARCRRRRARPLDLSQGVAAVIMLGIETATDRRCRVTGRLRASTGQVGGRRHAETLVPSVAGVPGWRVGLPRSRWSRSTSAPDCSPACGSGWPPPRFALGKELLPVTSVVGCPASRAAGDTDALAGRRRRAESLGRSSFCGARRGEVFVAGYRSVPGVAGRAGGRSRRGGRVIRDDLAADAGAVAKVRCPCWWVTELCASWTSSVQCPASR